MSKASLEIALIGCEEEASAFRQMPNTADGFGKLSSWIEKQPDVSLEECPEQVHVYLEASGGYHRSIARFLNEDGLTVSVINPRRTSAYAKSRLTRSKRRSTSTSNAPTPSPEGETCWRQSPALAGRPPHWCLPKSGIPSGSRAPVRQLRAQA